MEPLIYVRLIGFTAGTLLQLFWMVVILGHRRQRNFERVFFFLCLALFFFYGGSLLALNAQIYYSAPPPLLTAFAWTILCTGLCFLPPLILHLHLEYAQIRGLLKSQTAKHILLAAFYAPCLYFILRVYPAPNSGPPLDFLAPANRLGRSFSIWLFVSLMASAYLEERFGKGTRDPHERLFHRLVCAFLFSAGLLVLNLHIVPSWGYTDPLLNTVLALSSIVPMSILIYLVQRFNFLQIGRQRNLVYAVTVAFFALLYLGLVRRVSIWLEPVLPPEATSSILVFVLVIFFEPLQRLLARRLHETAHTEIDRSQRIVTAIQAVARQGDFAKLRRFIETWLQEQFELENVRLKLTGEIPSEETLEGSKPESTNDFAIRQSGKTIGMLHVKSHGAMLSGEIRAALEFLCEQLPGALELCRLIDEKLRLERELAERERLAVLGQMAASISHNLKNPLGSIKTILQVQLENPQLPDSIRGETQIVLSEIARLSAKLNQLLQFSRPAVRGGTVAAFCDPKSVVEEVVGVLRHEAERRGVTLHVNLRDSAATVAANSEALNDILSNLLVNALEATAPGGNVTIACATNHSSCLFTVQDDGPGITANAREKLLQPFFTTKTQGTGLGLAIVARRVAECAGQLDWDSPAANDRGTRFRVSVPLAKKSLDAAPTISTQEPQ
ncbi:MAG TPA: ATP-binding protein [Candidatus Acidoferrum sp.]|jgi:signal transduction histidine kinase